MAYAHWLLLNHACDFQVQNQPGLINTGKYKQHSRYNKFLKTVVDDRYPSQSNNTSIAVYTYNKGITLGMGSDNDRRRYYVIPFHIGWVHTQNDPSNASGKLGTQSTFSVCACFVSIAADFTHVLFGLLHWHSDNNTVVPLPTLTKMGIHRMMI